MRKKLIVAIACGLLPLCGNAQTVEPMVKAQYSQAAPFNGACPENSAAGCGPVALAQILSYYRQPAHGYGYVEYSVSGLPDLVKADFSSMVFDWDNIRDSYKGDYSAEEAAAVAQLIYACGAATKAQYGVSTSISNYALMLYGMQHYLHFSPESRYLQRKFYTTAEWIEMLNGQLRSGHPVFYRGSWLFNGGNAGHMFVVDGLDADGRYHVNFGHGGSEDKFVDLDVINQSGTFPGGRGVCYNATQAMVVNCFPTPDVEDYPEQRCIMYEPVVLNEDTTLGSVDIELGQAFKLSSLLMNCSGERATIKFGWGLERDGELLEMLSQGTFSLGAGYRFTGRRHHTIKLPVSLEDGDYRLVLYSCSEAEPEWAPVWVNAKPWADVYVNGSHATITIPERHDGDPMMYLSEPVNEVENEFPNQVEGRAFALRLCNETVNNFQDSVRLEIEADGHAYVYSTVLPVYSQTSPEFHILVPQGKVDLQGKTITSIRAAYRMSATGDYVELTTERPSTSVESVAADAQADILVYSLQGVLVGRMAACKVTDDYLRMLANLPHGVYIVKEGKKSRKILL